MQAGKAFGVRQLASISQGYEQGLQQNLWKSERESYPQILLAALWKSPGQLGQPVAAQADFVHQTKHGAPLPTRRVHFVKLTDCE
ncbi:hypothetical protein VSR34_26200 [Paraburkholderia sp. JHI2823]|uniref:hypothetical protein n=1 Tax=Paraburkholderia mimosarum TaxID=312026 RepID=UPI0012B59B8F|nr:hypothetical protein [Paraburkholderia mimosarum]